MSHSNVSPDFKKWVSDWTELDDLHSKAQKDINTVKKTKNELSTKILAYMEKNGIERTHINGVELRFNSKPKQKSLNKQFISECLQNSGMIKNQADVEKIVETIYNMKKTDERIPCLERCKYKK